MQHPKNQTPPEKGAKKFNFDEPVIFSIPRMYEDDYPRNDQWYIQLQKIEKKAKELKDDMLEITRRHSNLYRQTQQLISESLARRNMLIKRKANRLNYS